MGTAALPNRLLTSTACVDTIRVLAMDAVQRANSGHPGTPMVMAPVGYFSLPGLCATTRRRGQIETAL
jgi:hypothetical protein